MTVLSLVMPAPLCVNWFAIFQNVKITEYLWYTGHDIRNLDVICVNDEVEKPRERQMKREGLISCSRSSHVKCE